MDAAQLPGERRCCQRVISILRRLVSVEIFNFASDISWMSLTGNEHPLIDVTSGLWGASKVREWGAKT